jgi:D-sedoheptulose 7-phosphate isomerase
MENEIKLIAGVIKSQLFGNGKILLIGNGGSAADAQHIAAEFIGRFKEEKSPLPAIALTTDSSIISAIGNDYGFENIFAKQVEALGNLGDILIAISTSGNSPNIIKAVNIARQRGLISICLTGKNGGILKEISDYSLVIPSNDTARIQEMHILLGHIFCEYIDSVLV